VSAFVTAGAGFLLAVLWFDLMFDVQAVRGEVGGAGEQQAVLAEPVLASISGYYRRVTTAARPMNRLIAVAMLATLTGIVVEITSAEVHTWVGWTSLALALPPITLAGAHTVPLAVRLGTRADTIERQSVLARSILRDHVFCFTGIALLIAVQLAFA
jgi:hypothetical protein